MSYKELETFFDYCNKHNIHNENFHIVVDKGNGFLSGDKECNITGSITIGYKEFSISPGVYFITEEGVKLALMEMVYKYYNEKLHELQIKQLIL